MKYIGEACLFILRCIGWVMDWPLQSAALMTIGALLFWAASNFIG